MMQILSWIIHDRVPIKDGKKTVGWKILPDALSERERLRVLELAFLAGYQTAQREAGLNRESPELAVRVQLIPDKRGNAARWNIFFRGGKFRFFPHDLVVRKPKVKKGDRASTVGSP